MNDFTIQSKETRKETEAKQSSKYNNLHNLRWPTLTEISTFS